MSTDQGVEQNHSPHWYSAGDIECVDALRAALTPEEFKGWLKASAIAYIWRAKLKGTEARDYAKAAWCVARLIEEGNRQTP